MGNTGHAGLKVLIIDDDPVIHRLFSSILEHLGCQPIVAGTGAEGIQLARDHLPQLIILDYVMPDMDGLNTLSILKEREETKAIPVLMATGHLDDEACAKFIAAGAAECLAKPFEASAATAMIQKLIAPAANAVLPCKRVEVPPEK